MYVYLEQNLAPDTGYWYLYLELNLALDTGHWFMYLELNLGQDIWCICQELNLAPDTDLCTWS